MASSGSVDFSVTRDQIITAALQDMGVMAGPDTTSSASFTANSAMMAIKLNMIVKTWSGQADFAPGLKMWSRKTAYLFLQKNQAVYTLGPTGVSGNTTTDKWANAYVQTTIATAQTSGNNTLVLASATGIVTTNKIGVELSDGTIQWTTVNGAPSGATVTLTANLSGDAGAGGTVYAYAITAQGRRPLEVLTTQLRDTNGIDIPIDPTMTLDEYESISQKLATGQFQRAYYADTLIDGTIAFDMAAADVDHVVRIVYLSPIEDFDFGTDTPDYDQNWYLPLTLGLEAQTCMTFGRQDLLPTIQGLLHGNDKTLGALTIARNATPEYSRAYYEPDAPT